MSARAGAPAAVVCLITAAWADPARPARRVQAEVVRRRARATPPAGVAAEPARGHADARGAAGTGADAGVRDIPGTGRSAEAPSDTGRTEVLSLCLDLDDQPARLLLLGPDGQVVPDVGSPGSPLDRESTAQELVEQWGVTRLPTWIRFESAGGDPAPSGTPRAELVLADGVRFVEVHRVVGAHPKHRIEAELYEGAIADR